MLAPPPSLRYDSYLTPPDEWAAVLGAAGGERSIRGTASDAFVICLFVERAHEAYLSRAVGFDAFYTYFASDGFTYGSSTANWAQLVAMAARHGTELLEPSCHAA